MLKYGQELWDVILNLLTLKITFQASTPTQFANILIRPVHSTILYSLFKPDVESILREGLTTATVTLNRAEEVTGLEDLSPGYQEEVKFLLTNVARDYFQDLGEMFYEEYFGLAIIFLELIQEDTPRNKIADFISRARIIFFCPHCFDREMHARWQQDVPRLRNMFKITRAMIVPGLHCAMDARNLAESRSIESAIRSAFRRLLLDMANDPELPIKQLRIGPAQTTPMSEIIVTEEDLARAQHQSPFQWHEPPQYLVH